MMSKMTGRARTDALDVNDLMKQKKGVTFAEEDQIIDKDKEDQDGKEKDEEGQKDPFYIQEEQK